MLPIFKGHRIGFESHNALMNRKCRC